MPRRRPPEPKMPEHRQRMLAALVAHAQGLCGAASLYREMADDRLVCKDCGETIIQVRVEELLSDG